jgi:hypothetical protein
LSVTIPSRLAALQAARSVARTRCNVAADRSLPAGVVPLASWANIAVRWRLVTSASFIDPIAGMRCIST